MSTPDIVEQAFAEGRLQGIKDSQEAAREMLAALRRVERLLTDGHTMTTTWKPGFRALNDALDTLRSAIAKAEG